tara:strand:+ start:1029 stop:1199 length:171 start_codon:yes stop_codon:yes gene_type:complete
MALGWVRSLMSLREYNLGPCGIEAIISVATNYLLLLILFICQIKKFNRDESVRSID